LLDCKWSYNSIILLSDKKFVEKFIRPHQEAAPHLAEDYAAACRGKVPAGLMFASTDQPKTCGENV
jgi:mTERF domain-containing protein